MSSHNNNRKRQRREVVSEEEYTNTLERIITRDYFSDLPQLQTQAAVLDRRAAHDFEGTVRVRRAARRMLLMEEREQELEAQQEENNNLLGRKTARPLHRENLSGFHARVTSEDNAEFTRTHQKELAEQQRQLEAKYQKPLLLIKDRSGQDGGEYHELMASEERSYQLLQMEQQNKALWKQIPVRNNLFFTPSSTDVHHAAAAVPPQENSTSADTDEMVEGKRIERQDTALMPPPSNIPNNKHASMVQYIPKHMFEKTIEPSQTRFPTQKTVFASTFDLAISSSSSQQQRSSEDPDDAYAGHEDDEPSDDDASTDLDSVVYNHRPLHQERQARLRKQHRELNTMVPMSSPMVGNPGAPGPASPVIQNLGMVDTAGSGGGAVLPYPKQKEDEETRGQDDKSFVLPDASDRDKAAQRAQTVLEERRRRATANTRQTINKNSSSSKLKAKPKRSWMSSSSQVPGRRDDISSFSPAAMSLLSKTSQSRNNPSSVRSSSSFGSALRSSYTPQRISSNSLRRTAMNNSDRRGDHAYRATPPRRAVAAGEPEHYHKTVQNSSQTTHRKKTGNVTDGLLKL